MTTTNAVLDVGFPTPPWIAGLAVVFALSLMGCPPPEAPTEPQGGEVHGYIIADLSGQEVSAAAPILLPDAVAYLRNLSTNAESSRDTTDLSGFFVVPKQAPGRYAVCLEAPGYVSACPDTVSISDEMVSVGQLALAPEGPAVAGRVLLQDRRPCVFHDPVFGVSFHTDVRAVDAGGTEVSSAVRANTAGRYVLPQVDGGASRVEATCQATTGQQTVGQLPSGNLVNVTLPNSRPTDVVLVAMEGNEPVRRAAPGTTVQVSVDADDTDPLNYRWNVSGVGAPFAPQDTNSVEWTLPDSRGPNTIYVAVLDGRGGVALGKFSVSTGNEGLLFTGTVTADGAAVNDARVELNGVVTQTNRQGAFAVMAPEDSDRFVLTITKPGFQILSRVFEHGVLEGSYELVQAQQFNVDPNQGGTFVEETTSPNRPGAEVVLSPRSLVDSSGSVVTGPVSGFMSTIDLSTGRFPGDYGGINSDGEEVSINSLGAVDVRFTDGAENALDLASGATAMLRIPVDASQLELPGSPEAPPDTIPIWTYDANSGLWQEEGFGTLQDGFYEVEVTHFSTFNADFEFANPACMRIRTDVSTIPLPFDLRVSIPAASPSKVLTKQIADELSVIVRLPQNTDILLEVLDTGGNVIPGATVTQASGATSSPAFPPYNYASCTTEANLALNVPPGGSLLAGGSGIQTFTNNASEADYYYAKIDPASTAGAGTISSSGTTVIGTGTSFTNAVEVGQLIEASSQFRLVELVTNDTELQTESAFSPALPAGTSYNVVGAKHTLDAWKTANGFDDGEDREAIYLNAGDLGLGRWMRMEQDGNNISYYVSNHGVPPNAGAVDLAAFGKLTNDETLGLIATVAMEYSPHPTEPGGQYTKYYVYNAAGNRVNKADLDGNGEKYIPNLCVVCHGISPTNWKSGQPGGARADAGARFIFFDPESFEYSGLDDPANPGSFPFLKSHQEIAFRELNRGVKDETNVSDAVEEAIEGWYGGSTLPNAKQDPTFVPGGWSVQSSLYSDVVKPSCRACHTTRDNYLAWDTFNQASHPTSAHTGLDESASFARSLVCGPTRIMPHAVVTYNNFWLSTSPHQPAAMANVLSTSNPAGWPANAPCPCGGPGQPPC